jgi:hypothetical protein
MQRTIGAFLVVTTLLQPVIAWAEAPDETGAKKIEEAVKIYGPGSLANPHLLSKPGMVRVSPDGDGYRMVLDMTKVIAEALAPMTVKEAAPLAFKLLEQPDGKWTYASSTPFTLTTEYLAANRSANLALSTETGTIRGLYDPAIFFPREADIGFTNGVATLRDARDALKVRVKDGSLSSRTKDLPDGRGDVDGTFSIKDAVATHGTFPQPEMKITASQIDGSYKLGKVDLAGMADMLRFWTETAPDKDIMTLSDAQRDVLRALLVKHMPLIDGVRGKVMATNLSALEGGKGFKLEKLDYETRWEGFSGRAALIMAARITNLGIDPGVWPKGLEAILPKDAALNIKASGYDLGGLWKDAAQVRSPEETARLPRDHFEKIVLPDGGWTVDLTDSFARSSFYDVTLAGQIHMGKDPRKPPLGALTVTAKDLDGTVKYLQDNVKTVPIFGRVVFGLMVAKGLGKPGPDGTMVWELKFEEGGKITVNGQPLPMQR